jgi:hypothetical protein
MKFIWQSFICAIQKLMFSLIMFSVSLISFCQDCDHVTSELIRWTPGNEDFVFDNMTKYVGGITVSGSTILRLKVDMINPTCQWKLSMQIDNNPLAPTPPSEWETLDLYGSSGSIPQLDLLEVKVYNICNTPIISGFQKFNPINGDIITILDDIPLNLPAPCDGTHVNGAGSYISDYGEFTFIIDYRIQPGFTLTPGIYQITLHFYLEEVP